VITPADTRVLSWEICIQLRANVGQPHSLKFADS
jgi:hypothetical protein